MDTYLASVPAAARTGWLQLNGVQGGLMAAAKLMVMYPPPKDVQTFERVYVDEHVPMAVKSLPTGRRGTGLQGLGDVGACGQDLHGRCAGRPDR